MSAELKRGNENDPALSYEQRRQQQVWTKVVTDTSYWSKDVTVKQNRLLVLWQHRSYRQQIAQRSALAIVELLAILG